MTAYAYGMSRSVLYVGDADLQGNQIEANTRRVLERCIHRKLDWRRVAITDAQIAEHRLTPIWKVDGRYGRRDAAGKRAGKEHQAVECEALGQGTVRALLREALDALLPEPLSTVWNREDEQREKIREMFAQFGQ